MTVFTNGKTLVEYRLSTNATVPISTVPLFGNVFEQLITINEDNLPIDNRMQNGSLVMDTFGVSTIFVIYTTPDLVNGKDKIWTFTVDSPIDTSIRLPEESIIIGLNQMPNSIKLYKNQYVLIMPEGHNEISYIISTLYTKEQTIVALSEAEKIIEDHKNKGVVVSSAESKLNEAKNAFDNAKYTYAEILANDVKTITNNTSYIAILASNALSEAKTTINENNKQGFDIFNANQLFGQADQEYINGNYDEALNLAKQAKTIALDTRNDSVISFDLLYLITGIITMSAVAGTVVYIHFRKKTVIGKTSSRIINGLVVKKRRIINLTKILTEKPYLREDDKDVLNFIVENGGEVFENEIRDRFDLPKTTVWRLVKRLKREDLVDIEKVDRQNLIRIREQFTKTD
tara:strand:+ start:1490 stop:2695 length:1206 start_codon:yes stop_codon:yes gene_type:complete